MKEITITTKARAMSILLDSLFKPVNEHTLRPMPYCAGKYVWHGSQSHYVGKTEQVHDGVHALWVERRVDRDGPYAVLMCLTEA